MGQMVAIKREKYGVISRALNELQPLKLRHFVKNPNTFDFFE